MMDTLPVTSYSPEVHAAFLLSNFCFGGMWEQVHQFSHGHGSVCLFLPI